MLKSHLKLFFTGFIQVFLVSANTYFIAKTEYAGIAICGFGISYVWTFNIKKISIGSKMDQLVYSLGAMSGGLIGVILASKLKRW